MLVRDKRQEEVIPSRKGKLIVVSIACFPCAFRRRHIVVPKERFFADHEGGLALDKERRGGAAQRLEGRSRFASAGIGCHVHHFTARAAGWLMNDFDPSIQ